MGLDGTITTLVVPTDLEVKAVVHHNEEYMDGLAGQLEAPLGMGLDEGLLHRLC